jgi:hypothetical protein
VAVSYPLTPPARGLRELRIHARAVVGMSESPFTMEQQVYAHPGDCWRLEAALTPMERTDADAWNGFRVALNGRQGTFLLGPGSTVPKGTWAGAPAVNGAHAQRAKTIHMKGFTLGATVKAGDFFQHGTGANAHLYMVVQDASALGSPTGQVDLEIWPSLRAALANNDTFVTTNPVGLWRLATNETSWSRQVGQIWDGMSLSAVEAL